MAIIATDTLALPPPACERCVYWECQEYFRHRPYAGICRRARFSDAGMSLAIDYGDAELVTEASFSCAEFASLESELARS